QPRKSRVEIVLQILYVLEPDGKPQGGAVRLPSRRRAVGSAVERNDEALEPAPGITHAEQLQLVEEGRYGFPRAGLQNDREQAARAEEVALPQRVARVGGERRVQHAGDLLARLQPLRHGEAGA